MRIIVSLLVLFLLSGCGVDYKCEVRSDTSWTGYFGDRTVDGTGNQTISLSDESGQCVDADKETEAGYLEIRLIEEGGWFLNPTNDYEPVRTTEEYGYVDACFED